MNAYNPPIYNPFVPAEAIDYVTAVVTQVRQDTPQIRVYELRDADGWRLPPFTAGAHIDIRLPQGGIRQYSLANDPADDTRYLIGILHEAEGRGGSAALHQHLAVGTQVKLSLPRNAFPLGDPAGHTILIAGGIGITPLLSMAHTLRRAGRSFELVACARSDAHLAFREELAGFGGNVRLHHSAAAGRLDLSTILGTPRPDTHVYACGPQGLIDDILALAAAWPEGTVQVERFAGLAPGADLGDAFAVDLARSGKRLDVPRDQTLLQVLRDEGFAIDSACRNGICGTCRVKVLEGDIDHRDKVLSASDRPHAMMACVSRARGTLVLDL